MSASPPPLIIPTVGRILTFPMHMTHQFMQVDAFTTHPLSGNPCAVVFDADDLSSSTMQAIAKENNLSETAFVLQSDVADVGARYFTPDEEIPMAGHPTIATIYALATTGRLSEETIGDRLSTTKITLQLPAGVLPIEIKWTDVSEAGHHPNIEQVVMAQLAPEFGATYSPNRIMPIFGLKPNDVLPNSPIQVVSTGTPQLMIPVRDLDTLRRVNIDANEYVALRRSENFFSPHLFCMEGATAAGDTFARHVVASLGGSFEDPFTGSATGGMGAYAWHHGLIDSPKFVAEQGHWMGRPGQASVEIVGPPGKLVTVKIGGRAVTTIRGELLV